MLADNSHKYLNTKPELKLGDVVGLQHQLHQFVRSRQPQLPRLSNAPSLLDLY